VPVSEHVCSVCGDVITPGTMNASGVEVRESGIVCGVCVDASNALVPDRYVAIDDSGSVCEVCVPCADEGAMVTRGDKLVAALLCVPDAELYSMLMPWMPAEGQA
jgi:hypothetical protein